MVHIGMPKSQLEYVTPISLSQCDNHTHILVNTEEKSYVSLSSSSQNHPLKNITLMAWLATTQMFPL